MRYHYESVEVATHQCNHPLYDRCTLYTKNGKGLAVLQHRYSPRSKMAWLGPIDKDLIYAIASKEGFDEYFDEHAKEPDDSDLYPSVSVRTIMWALKMKPLKKSVWEKGLDS